MQQRAHDPFSPHSEVYAVPETAPPTAHHPAAGAGTRRETLTELDQFLVRLARLGATADELEAVTTGWDTFDAEWTPEYRRRLALAPDAELTAHLEAIRAEHHENTTTDEEAELERLEALEKAEHEGALGILEAGHVAEVVGWVKAGDTDEQRQARAFAVYHLEGADDGRARKGVLEATAADAAAWNERMIAAEDAAGVEPIDDEADDGSRVWHPGDSPILPPADPSTIGPDSVPLDPPEEADADGTAG